MQVCAALDFRNAFEVLNKLVDFSYQTAAINRFAIRVLKNFSYEPGAVTSEWPVTRS